MKTTLALLIAGFLLLTTPLLGFAHGGGRHDSYPGHHKGWVKDRHDYRGGDRCDDYRHYRSKKHFKKHVREHRRDHHRQLHREHHRDHRRIARHSEHHQRQVVAFGIPPIVFHIDW